MFWPTYTFLKFWTWWPIWVLASLGHLIKINNIISLCPVIAEVRRSQHDNPGEKGGCPLFSAGEGGGEEVM